MALALFAAQKFCESILSSPWDGGYCLSLLGKSGTGKTFLTRCVLSALGRDSWNVCRNVKEHFADGRLRKFEARFFDLRAASDKIKSGQWGLIEAMVEPEFAVLDDLGADYDPNKFFAGKIDQVLRARSGKWTILTSNYPISQLGLFLDNRIASWIIRDDNKYVEIEAGDYALETTHLKQ